MLVKVRAASVNAYDWHILTADIFLVQLIEAGKIKPVIDKRYRLAETAEALRYLGTGHARGKVVITVG
jgi:NADPH:quinone reductase-like Zn-dependent oxidoreductase